MIVESAEGVTLAGGAPFGASLLRRALGLAPVVVAADGGADRLLAKGVLPQAVIGDMDSISPKGRARLAGRLFTVGEQLTTDFDKALRHLSCPFTLAIGFTGARLDHGLAVLNTLARHPHRRCLVLSSQELIFLAPPRLSLALPAGMRASLFPLGKVRGCSRGLVWPIDGLDLAPDGMIGTSNRVSGDGPVQLEMDRPGMLVILPLRALDQVLAGLGLGAGQIPAEVWPEGARQAG